MIEVKAWGPSLDNLCIKKRFVHGYAHKWAKMPKNGVPTSQVKAKGQIGGGAILHIRRRGSSAPGGAKRSGRRGICAM